MTSTRAPHPPTLILENPLTKVKRCRISPFDPQTPKNRYGDMDGSSNVGKALSTAVQDFFLWGKDVDHCW